MNQSDAGGQRGRGTPRDAPTFPCIRSLMVSVTLSPPSDWTLTGSISGLGVRMWAWSDGAESADGSPANQR